MSQDLGSIFSPSSGSTARAMPAQILLCTSLGRGEEHPLPWSPGGCPALPAEPRMLPMSFHSILKVTSGMLHQMGQPVAFWVSQPHLILAACPPGRGGCSASCSAFRARRGPAGPGLISLSHFSSFLLARRALTRCEIVANSTEYFKSSNAVMAVRQSSEAGRELGWALASPPPPPTH